ncbi:MAG: GHMP kinase [Burkholderiales bacterium]|nr:GHMP kinase [Phycisphaerae bacterium]
MSITAHAYARAGLVGNPSDGYFGKTISFVIRNYSATVKLWETPQFEILPTHGDFAKYDSVTDFLREQRLYGYYGGQRLMKAAVKKFYDFCQTSNQPLHDRNFTLQFQTDIPRLVGLSGSSGIVVATMRALCEFYGVTIPQQLFPGVVLSAEKDELGITAGLQDRVIQVYEGMVFMDFDRKLMETRGYGEYESLTPDPAPPLYVAFDAERAEVSDITHRNLRQLFEKGDPQVVGAMLKYRDLTDRGRAAILSGDWDALHKVTDENFELRKTIMNIAPENQRMVDVARSAGTSAKFAGSGGAICGVYHGEKQFEELTAAMRAINCTVIKPQVFG